MVILAVVGGAVLGLIVGSFLNVVAHRVPGGRSVVRPPSACPNCQTPILPRDNIPVLSWFLLRGKCRACSAPISVRYPLVEVFAPPSGDFTAIRELSAFMMIGLSSYVMADAVILVSSGILRGAGDTRWLMVASVSLHWAMLVAQFFIIRVFELSPKVSWLAFVAMILAIALVYALRLKSGRWRDPAALERVMAE